MMVFGEKIILSKGESMTWMRTNNDGAINFDNLVKMQIKECRPEPFKGASHYLEGVSVEGVAITLAYGSYEECQETVEIITDMETT